MPEMTPPVNLEAQAHAEAAQAEADRLADEAAAADTVEVRFLRPLGFGGVDYPVGVHKVPREALENDPLAETHALDGNIVPVGDVLAKDGRPTAVTRAPARKTAKR